MKTNLNIKHILQSGAITLTAISLPLISSCDDDGSSSSRGNLINNGNNTGGSNNGGGGTTNGSFCLEGKTFHFIGEQTTTLSTDTAIGNITTTTKTNTDLTIAYLANGINQTTGTVTITSIESSTLGNLPITNQTSQIDQQGTYIDVCEEHPEDGVTYSETHDGVTTTYTINYTSDTSGTYSTTTSGSPSSGGNIQGTSTGTFTSN